MNPWIARIILVVLALEAGICVAFLADDWRPLRHQEESFFQSALTASREGEQFVLDEGDPLARVRNVRPLEPGSPQRYFQVPVGEAINASSPPIPEDWHLLLKHMHEVGCRVAAIEQPLTWTGEDFYHLFALSSLDRSLALYDVAVLTVDLQRVQKPDPIPDYLRRSAIPLANVRGEVGSLVRVNRVIHPPSASAASNIRFSFRVQESVEDATPAFVRWDDYLIPSFPLAVAMAQNDVAPDEVTIELGRHIRLGEGPLVRIDEIGQLRIDLVEEPMRAEMPADDLVLASQIPSAREAAGDEVPRCVLFLDATADNPAPWPTPQRLQQLVSSFDVQPRPVGLEPHRRLPLWGELLLLASIAGAGALLLTFRGTLRIGGFLVLAALISAVLAMLFVQTQRWTPVAPLIVTTAVGLFLTFRLARHLPPAGNAPPAEANHS